MSFGTLRVCACPLSFDVFYMYYYLLCFTLSMNLLNYTFFKYILFYTFTSNERQAYHNLYAMNAFSTVKIFKKPWFFMGSEHFINNSLTHSRFTKFTYEDIRVAYSIQYRSFEIRHPSQEWPPLQCVSFSYTRKAQIRVLS